jgi:hypothetical protein
VLVFGQIVTEGETEREGAGIRLIVIVLVLVPQPGATAYAVYVVVAVGVTTIVAPLTAPGFHEKDVAPRAVAIIVAVLPGQIKEELGVQVKIGLAITLTVIVFVLLQPEEFIPVTVYIVVTVGETEVDAVVAPDGCQV